MTTLLKQTTLISPGKSSKIGIKTSWNHKLVNVLSDENKRRRLARQYLIDDPNESAAIPERRNKSQLKYNVITNPVEKITTSPYIMKEVERHENALRGAAKIMLNNQ